MNKKFEEWIKGSGLDPIYGYLIPKEYEPKHFNKNVLLECIDQLIYKLQAQAFSEFVEQIPDIQFCFKTEKDPNDEFLARDCFLLHGIANKIIAGYIAQKQFLGVPTNEIVIPKNIGVPLYEASKFLKIKYGMTTDYYFNWQAKDIDCSKKMPEFIHVSDLKLLQNFSLLFNDQNMFFGGQVVGSHCLFQSIKILFQVNELLKIDFLDPENKIVKLLDRVALYIEKMVETILYMFQNINPALFDEKNRQYFRGFKDLKFESVEERLSSGGGAGGFDPLYQLFERILGLKFQNKLKAVHEAFQLGFSFPIFQLFKDVGQSFKIRQLCNKNENLKTAYNKIISLYSKFFTVHLALLQKTVLKGSRQANFGAAGVNIQDIVYRNNAVSQQKLN